MKNGKSLDSNRDRRIPETSLHSLKLLEHIHRVVNFLPQSVLALVIEHLLDSASQYNEALVAE